MARRAVNDENIRKIQKSKRSYYVTLPIEYVRKLGWREQQKVVVHKPGKRLMIEDFKEND
jgi:bifunctional DNA-binding transcriptional regulator/antitoxin component of YhaV-PrlF toxin-antitoxin module